MDALAVAFMGGSTVIGGVIWLIRLEGRVNTHEAECALRQKRADERHGEMKEQLDGISSKLDRLVERA